MLSLLLLFVFSISLPLSCISNDIESIITNIGNIPLSSHCLKNLNNAEESNINGNPEALMHNAVCFHVARDDPRALYLYGRVRDHNPDYAYVLVNIAIIALKGGDADTAIILFEQYLYEAGGMYGDKTPSDKTLVKDGTPCRADATHKSDCVSALNGLGSAHMSKTDSKSALPYLKRAIQIGDAHTLRDVYSNLGGHFSNIGDSEAAADAFLKAFWISFRNGHMDTASLIRRAISIPVVPFSSHESENVRVLFQARIKDMIELAEHGGSSIADDIHDLFRTSAGISNHDDIKSLPPLKHTLTDWTSGIQTPHFYLHYYGFHDRPLQELVAKMYSVICAPSLYGVSPHLLQDFSYSSLSGSMYGVAPIVPSLPTENSQLTESTPQERRLRIGFVSSHFGGDEPHGLLLIDVIRRLPKNIFQVVAVGIGPKKPSQDFLDAVLENFHSVGYNDDLARRVLSNEELDCLVFVEMQNEAVVHFLGYQRFAPIQVLVMGAPVTSGNPSIDYFISGDRLEHPFRTHLSGKRDSEEHYSEQVVLLDGQAISFPHQYEHPIQDARIAAGDGNMNSNFQQNIDSFGIPYNIQNGQYSIYMCFQSIHKIQPFFDKILAQILHSNQNAYIILQASRKGQVSDSVSKRLMNSFVDYFCVHPGTILPCYSAKTAFSRVLFIPRVTSDKISSLLQKSSVILHPWPFGGSKTAADAINAGVPLVTYPQPYLRGRMAASFYTTMELHTVDADISAASCCVANSVSDYISKAVRLGNDRAYRDKVASAISKRSHRIWDDKQTSFEWARFLTRALGVVTSDKDLALEMDYVPETWQEDDVTELEILRIQNRWKLFHQA